MREATLAKICELLDLSPDDIDDDYVPLVSLGMDSLSAVELANWASDMYGTPSPASVAAAAADGDDDDDGASRLEVLATMTLAGLVEAQVEAATARGGAPAAPPTQAPLPTAAVPSPFPRQACTPSHKRLESISGEKETMPRHSQRRWLVPDAAEAKSLRVKLRSSDLQFLWSFEVPVGYLFTTQLDAEAVTRGLERALELYPLLAGRLGKHVDAEGVKRLHIGLARSKGALWEVVHDGDSPLPEPAAAAPPSGARGRSAAPPCGPGFGSWWDRFFPKPVRLLPALWEPAWRRPLLRARLTQLTAHGASVLTLCVAHVSMDGMSVHAFVSTWSHFAGLEAAAASGAKTLVLPAVLPCAVPTLDRTTGGADFERLVDDVRRQHEEQNRGVRGGKPLATWRMGLLEMAAWLPRLYVAHFTDVRADFSLAADDVASLKVAASAGLADGEWLSSFEVIAAALCCALADVDAVPRRAAMPAPAQPYHVRVLANSRGRERLSPEGYVGNAIHFARAQISPDAQLQQQTRQPCGGTAPLSREWLWRAARDVRGTLRASVADGAAIERAHAAFEHGVRHGRANASPMSRLCWYKSWAQNFTSSDGGGAPIVINSWLSFPWLDVTFGASERPALMRVPTSFSYRRFVLIAPRSPSGELCVRVQLPAAQLRRFEATVKALGLPLRRLHHK